MIVHDRTLPFHHLLDSPLCTRPLFSFFFQLTHKRVHPSRRSSGGPAVHMIPVVFPRVSLLSQAILLSSLAIVRCNHSPHDLGRSLTDHLISANSPFSFSLQSPFPYRTTLSATLATIPSSAGAGGACERRPTSFELVAQSLFSSFCTFGGQDHRLHILFHATRHRAETEILKVDDLATWRYRAALVPLACSPSLFPKHVLRDSEEREQFSPRVCPCQQYCHHLVSFEKDAEEDAGHRIGRHDWGWPCRGNRIQ
jgi:hypothetical protein